MTAGQVIGGYECARLGEPRSANPFPPGSDAWDEWLKGHERFHTDKETRRG